MDAGQACDGDVAWAELLVWFGERPKIKLLPWACDAGGHDEFVCEKFSDAWHIGAAADDKDLLDFAVIDEALVLIADDFADFADDPLEAWA